MFRWGFERDPLLAQFSRLQSSMDDLFRTLTTAGPQFRLGWRPGRIFPLLNVRKLDDAFVITAEIPGMKAEDLDIKVEGDTISLKGERKTEELGEGASYHRRERAAGAFHRSLTLPARVDADNVKASYRNGVLTITLPLEKAALPKQISVATE
jgi:HSP20 family protein